MALPTDRISVPLLLAALVVGLVLGPLLVGFEPVGADPDLMYRPIKAELARALSEGRLPFWSDRFGLGIPLVAESHAAAFYPWNWLAYRSLSVSLAYRLAMWLHHVALVLTTYAYARNLKITPWGAALASVAFTLCGYQAIHSGHEPLYHAMPYLPLCLLLADRAVLSGTWPWAAGLALAWGAQLTVGHFQIQMWTAGLAIVSAAWRARVEQRRMRRVGLVIAGLIWGAAVAWVQLAATRELTTVSGFRRPFNQLMLFSFPPSHWAQFGLPGLFLARGPDADGRYWAERLTTVGEACAYAGIIPLVLACVGAVAGDRRLAVWKWLVPASFALATMPRWWLDGYWAITLLPGLGWFRAPARYTLLTSLGLALLAGRGLDRAIDERRFHRGLILAIGFGAAAWAWSLMLASQSGFRAMVGASSLPIRFGASALAWAVGVGMVIAWRRGRVGAWMPIAVAAVELGVLFHLGSLNWGRPTRLPEASPILARLSKESDVGLVAGRLENLPVWAGKAPSYAYLGITAPPPNYILEASNRPDSIRNKVSGRWMRRFGVTHGVWDDDDDTDPAEVVLIARDEALDRLLRGGIPAVDRRRWKLVRHPDPAPPIWVARKVVRADNWEHVFGDLSFKDAPDEAWYQPQDLPPESSSPRARSARVVRWDGLSGEIEHDGACDLIVRRTWYPGWSARIDGGPDQPVRHVNGGLQGVRLDGSGLSRVTLTYRPTGLRFSSRTSLVATTSALIVVGFGLVRRPRAGAP